MEERMTNLEKGWSPKRCGVYDVFPSVPATRDKILDAIAQMAFANLGVYGNCCRSTLWAVQVHLRCEDPALLRASSVLAGGICGTGETCGVVLGGLMAIGDALGSEDFRDLDACTRAAKAAREFVDRIREHYGSTRCHDLQEAMLGWRPEDPSQAEEWFVEGGATACSGLCAEAARSAAGIILDCRADES